MKYLFGVLWICVFAIPAASAQVAAAVNSPAGAKVYRCGNTYTNDATEAQARGCKALEGANLTVVQGTRVAAAVPRTPAPAIPSASPGPRVDSSEQQARDADARFILEAELRKALARQGELLREYNNGEPEKLGPETRNYQKYLDRVAALRASISRNDQDIHGLRRELSRLTASK